MNLLHWLFNKLTPMKGYYRPNWLSVKYYRWKGKLDRERERLHKKALAEYSTFFQVPGAGEIAISNDPHMMTGGTVGFSFGVSWGGNNYSGGVLGRTEAMRLARFIIDKCNDIEETEEEEYKRFHKEFTFGNGSKILITEKDI